MFQFINLQCIILKFHRKSDIIKKVLGISAREI